MILNMNVRQDVVRKIGVVKLNIVFRIVREITIVYTQHAVRMAIALKI